MSSKPHYKVSIVFAVILHITIFIFLLLQLKLPAKLPSLPENNTPIVHATAINQQQVEQALSKLKASEQAKQAAKIEHAKKLQEQREQIAKLKMQQEILKQQQLQQERIQEAKLKALKQREQAEQQRINNLKKVAALAKQKQIEAAHQAKQKALLAAKRREQLTKQKQLSKQKQEDANDLLQKQLANEQQQLNAARTHYVAGELDKYKSLILNAIGQQWLIPEGSDKELSATLLIRLAPGGMVLNVQVEKSSGDVALDHSAVTAVYKASPLPVPSDPSLFNDFRELSLIVRPENIIAG